MIVVTKPGIPSFEIERICAELRNWNVTPEISIGTHKTIVGLVGDTAEIDPRQIQNLSPFIEEVVRVEHPFKQASLAWTYSQPSEVIVQTPSKTVTIGKNYPLIVVAGPCSVENEEMIVETALQVKAAGAQFLRGGAFKPRTSPYAFQGHGETALEWLAAAKEVSGLGIITEVMDAGDLDRIAAVADVIQIGARNMQNFSLLKKIAGVGKPILLKRGMSATIEDWLMAAEYILAAGKSQVILCERGIRTFDRKYTRNTLDLSAIPVLRTLTHLPIMIDPSHGTGKSEYVPAMAKAAIAAGCDSLMIEVHPHPDRALSDGPQSLTVREFEELMQDVGVLSQVFGRSQPSQFANATMKRFDLPTAIDGSRTIGG
ncbi:MAG: 3-deoxy-7-phosphoheptulonate synthase [Hydrococcus sp. Prado102]|jgi:3-deoxy-7-phosphoheptulonate synthase|nr:3-deoxy-7-phosphoheptulonate synthase [Hydrococcus sp. Prado102]